MDVSAEKQRELLYSMIRIRMVQERIESLYLQDQMKTPVHLCIGQEAVAVGVCALLEKDDYISSNHRGHGHYLAKGGDLCAMIAELHCKKTGCSKGHGGSMHLVDASVGHLGSTSIVGGGIPIGTGLGLAIRMKKETRVSVIFFGDGAVDEGVLYESINFSMLKKLPVIYVFENNQWSVCSHVSTRQIDDNIFHRASPNLLFTKKIDGNDILMVYETMCKALERARSGQGPSFIECETYRILGHAGCAAQDPEGYRMPRTVEAWKKKCPILNFQRGLLDEEIVTPDELTSMEQLITAEIDAAFAFALESQVPTEDDLHRYLFCE